MIIEYEKKLSRELSVTDPQSVRIVHYKEDTKTGKVETELLDSDKIGLAVETENDRMAAASFEAESFSVYGIVKTSEEPAQYGDTAADLSVLTGKDAANGFYLSVTRGTQSDYYFQSAVESGAGVLKETTKKADGAVWFFEPVDGSDDQFRIYTTVGGAKRYIKQKKAGDNPIELADEGSAFVISRAAEGLFNFKLASEDRWLQHSKGGKGIRLYQTNGTQGNTRIKLTLVSHEEPEDDVYGLDGKTYGIAYQDGSAISAALSATGKTSGSQQRLEGFRTKIQPDVLDNDGVLLVSGGTDIQEWTFESIEKDNYYITTKVDGEKKYLTINGANVTLQDTADPKYSVINARPGTGENAGKWLFSAEGYALNLAGKASDGFNGANGDSASTWMNLVEKSVISDNDFYKYNAKKVSVSDTENVYDGQQVVIYTRIWNDETKRYEFCVVDHDGSLIRCHDNGDGIEWIGTDINTALWKFTEYTDSEGKPNHYYELQNVQYGNYIAPQLSAGEVLSNNTVGINMSGRYRGKSETTIIAWDDDQYSYSGLKAENGKIVPCPLSEAQDFYFAIMNPVSVDETISTVNTVDNDEYGITMKMIDYNNPVLDKNGNRADNTNGRDSGQTAVLGYDTNKAGLLSTQIGEEESYPMTNPANTGKDKASLETLYNGSKKVNHLFLKSIYNESGYFEYDSTSNFAHLNGNGDFTVYDQIASISDYSGKTGTHGQFLPYNEMKEGKYTSFTNQTDVSGNELPDSDPRKGEKLYDLGDRKSLDYFFGMEMTASFTQTANGLDAWGHDIIFEFSGDDDFWFYVDGELILDLGGVHSAQTGSINFRTGEVKSSRGNSTLYDIVKSNLQGRGMSQSDIKEKLDAMFVEKTVNGKTVHVFGDYTNHTMNMFYMERGAGASNLHMRFNLAAVKPGNVELSKRLSGTENAANDLIEFPYQIWYTTEDVEHDATYHRLGEEEKGLVTYKDTINPVTYRPEITIDGVSYEDVFMLKPGQSAVIDFPEKTVDYYIVECGVNTSVYDKVTINDAEAAGVKPAGAASDNRKDYATSKDSVKDRPKVDYVNHVSDDAMRTLQITKKLYDADGKELLHYPDVSSLFSFRLNLGNEYADPEDLPLANLYSYMIKDADGNYCRWNAKEQKFESLGIRTYDELKEHLEGCTDSEREAIVFRTSMNGSISKIPADYTVEVRDLIAGTQWKVEERDGEIPRGFTRRDSDGYARVDAGHEAAQSTPVSGTMQVNEDPEVEVRNQKGWGLTVKKVWTDKDFMESRDDIYFAVYIGDELADGTVRRLSSNETELYYFFQDLRDKNNETHNFAEFNIREVTLAKGADFHVDEKTGAVSGYTDLQPVEEGESVTVGGTPVGGSYHPADDQDEGFSYKVSYEVGEPTGHNENIRTDTVTNSRPGIRLFKTMWNWETALGQAVFTLKDEKGADVAAASYTSDDSNGLITTAYLEPGEYELSEIKTPEGYIALDQPLVITANEDGTFGVSGDENFFRYDEAKGDMPSVYIRNRQVELKAVKTDASTGDPVEGAHFALYPQVTNSSGEKVKDYTPVKGFEDMVTDENGLLQKITFENLTRGNTYYLTETQAAEGYDGLDSDICFTVGNDGKVSISSAGHSGWLRAQTDTETGKTTYTLTIPNGKMKKLSFMKVDIADTDTPLAGGEFDLYKATDGGQEESPYMEGLVSGDDGMLSKNGGTVFELPAGTYHLVETKAPAGYVLKEDAVVITVTDAVDTDSVGFDTGAALYGVSYDEGTALSGSGYGRSYDAASGVYTLKISNTAGVELPHTGGMGTTVFYIFGTVLTIGCAMMLISRRRIGQ